MYPVAIALLGAAGAWLAWRRNPLYAETSTLRRLAVAVLTLSAATLLVLAVLEHTRHRAESTAITTLLTVIILATLAALYIVQAGSLPKSAQLNLVVPPSASEVRVHRHRVVHWIRITVLLLALCTVVGEVCTDGTRYIVLYCDVILTIGAGIVLAVMYWNAWRFDRSLTALQCDPWVHWRYGPEEWHRWTDPRADGADGPVPGAVLRRLARRIAWLLLAAGAGALVFSLGSLAERIDFTLICLAGLSLTIILGWRLDRRGPERRAGREDGVREEGVREAFIGRDGLYVDGIYTLWHGAGVSLVSATLDARDPGCVRFEFQKIMLNPYGPNRVASLVRRVPVPQAREADLKHLQRELSARCPQSRVALG